MNDVQSILEQLGEFRKHQEYDQDATFRLMRSIVEACNDFHDRSVKYEAFIWKLLVTAHTNGLRSAAGGFAETARTITENAHMIAVLHRPDWPAAKG